MAAEAFSFPVSATVAQCVSFNKYLIYFHWTSTILIMNEYYVLKITQSSNCDCL